MDDLTTLTLVDASAAIARREVSPVELTEAYLARIEKYEPMLNAYTTVVPERARADAARAQEEIARHGPRGPLHGIPVGLKDLFDTAGVRTTAGSAIYRERVPDTDSAVAARLRAAGTVLLGKHATHEFAWGGTCDNPHYGPVRNPYDRQRIPGGSSGGSAASVVARTALVSVGTDTCGSVRIPAAFSGCVGVKPAYGRISLAGVVPLGPSLDHVGPIARTVADAAVMLGALVDQPLDLRLDEDVAGLRIGVLHGYFDDGLDPAVAAAVAVDRLAGLGCAVHDLIPPNFGPIVDLIFEIVLADAQPYHAALFARTPEGYGPALRAVLSQQPPTTERIDAVRAALRPAVEWLSAALQRVDVLVCATEPATAPPIGAHRVEIAGRDVHIEWMLTRLTSIFNLARLPAVSVPCGQSAAGLPMGFQVVAGAQDERTALRVARAAEVRLDPPRLD
jgi:aspartyl-tRNA(Asn)/glutamyl-tRNA(Gln) amidotransferase subunit A